MAPKNTRKDGNKASKGGDQLHSKAETDTEAIATAKADSDNASMNYTAEGRVDKRRRVSTTPIEASDSFSASATEVTADTSAGAAGGEDASTSGVPSDPKSTTATTTTTSTTTKSYAETGVLEAVISIDGCEGYRGFGRLPMVGEVDCIETIVAVRRPAESVRPILGSHSIVSVSDAAAAAATSIVTVTVTVAVTMVAATYKEVISSLARANESNFISAENYYILHWLYRIRNVSCPRGLRISFLQPDFLWSIYRPMMRSKKMWRTDGDIKVAANLWCFDRAEAEKRYGRIGDWDVSSVTDMSELFQGQGPYALMGDRFRGKDLFNDDISRWDVSKVTNMTCMFKDARAFNQPIERWVVSKVTNMSQMFYGAESFNQPVGDWDVSKVTNMSGMFSCAHSFHQPVGDWDVSKVTNISFMFYRAVRFDQDLTKWNMSSVESTDNMFRYADAMQRDNKPAAVRDDVYGA